MINVDITMKEVQSEQELKNVLARCYRVLGEDSSGLYGYEAWRERFFEGAHPMVYAQVGQKIVSAVLGRAENKDSLVIGMVACDEAYRKQGITKALMAYFENLAAKMGYKYITLGSHADVFYEKCGYQIIFQMHDQNVYQKLL